MVFLVFMPMPLPLKPFYNIAPPHLEPYSTTGTLTLPTCTYMYACIL